MNDTCVTGYLLEQSRKIDILKNDFALCPKDVSKEKLGILILL